jgi:hypothetical protein
MDIKKFLTWKILEPIGLLMLLLAFCWQTISNGYRNQEQQIYQSNIDNVLITTADMIASYSFRDTINYKGHMVTNFDPEAIHMGTSAIYAEQDFLSKLYHKYRHHYFMQVILYILGSSLIVIEKFLSVYVKE